MTSRRIGPKTLAALAISLAAPASPLMAQTFTPDPVEATTIAVQLEKPFLAGADGLAGYSSILEADAIFPLGSVSLRFGIPIAFAGADFVDGTSVYMGNLRASLLFGTPGQLSSFIDLKLATASNMAGPDFAVLVAVLPWLGELEKWIEDSLTVSAARLPAWQLSGGGAIGLQLGGAAIIATTFENLNLDARVGGWVRVPTNGVDWRAELSTSYLVTSDDGFREQFTAYADLGAALSTVPMRPGLFVRLPLDGDGRQVHDFSVGISAQF